MESTIKKAQRSNCLSQWWNQKYPHQKRLELVFEHPLFHLLIIIFVVGECGSVITEILLHSVQHRYECNSTPYFSRQRTYKLEHEIKICHYISLSILLIFIFELILKIYAFGYHYWNCKENHKLDYFDAFLVVVSFTIDIYLLIVDKKSIIAHSAILIVILRFWHLLQIANAVARCFQKGNEFKILRQRRHSKKSFEALIIPSSILVILDLMQEKTECLRCDTSVEQSLVDRFEEIDQKCQDVFEDYYGNETKLLEEMQKLHLVTKRIQNKKNYSIDV